MFKKEDKTGIVLVAAGLVLILLALTLFLYNFKQDTQAGRQAQTLLTKVQSAIQEKKTQFPNRMPAASLASEMPATEINGYAYVGYLSIPTLELELPVMAEWDYERLKIAPCRQFGSARTNDLVIAAHNYKNHFGRLWQLEEGDALVFTDMDGVENSYQVALTQTLASNEVDAVQNSGYDLVLYTCTFSGKTRCTVFCNRQEKAAKVSDKDEGSKDKLDDA